MPAAQADEWVGAAFRQAGADRGGALELGEFITFYRGMGASRARLELRTALGPAAESEPLLRFPRGFRTIFCRFSRLRRLACNSLLRK